MKKSILSVFLVVMLITVFACQDQKQKESSDGIGSQTDAAILSKKITPSIVPGERLEGMILGESATKILDSLGHPESGDAAMGKALRTWHVKDVDGGASLSLFTSTNMGVEDFSRIQQIRTTATLFSDAHNLGVGDSLSALQMVYSLEKVGTFTDNGLLYDLYESPEGIAFEVDLNQLVHGIVVHPKNVKAAEIYLPFYKDFKSVEED